MKKYLGKPGLFDTLKMMLDKFYKSWYKFRHNGFLHSKQVIVDRLINL